MKDQAFIRPQSDPPPYPGPPGAPGQSYSGYPTTSQPILSGPSGASGQGYTGYPGYPTTSQPTLSGVYAHPMTANTTIIQGTNVVPVVLANTMGPDPAQVICKSCQQPTMTRLETSPSVRTHLCALLLCLLGCWPCACMPYCVNSCNNADHYCTNCNAYIGSYVG